MSARGQSAFSITLVARPLLAKIWGRARGFVTLPNDTRWIELEHPCTGYRSQLLKQLSRATQTRGGWIGKAGLSDSIVSVSKNRCLGASESV